MNKQNTINNKLSPNNTNIYRLLNIPPPAGADAIINGNIQPWKS